MHDVNDAISKIQQIHHQLARTRIYKGYRSFYVGLGGIIGLASLFVQPNFVDRPDSLEFVLFWMAVASINLVMCICMIGYQYFFIETSFERKMTVKVVEQFSSMIAAGLIITLAFIHMREGFLLLPGIWAVIFGLGIFLVRPYLPDMVALGGIYYLISALLLFFIAFNNQKLLLAGQGITFALGQFVSSALLYWCVEKRESNDE